jgi:amino-acid N-acetyltransferase
LRNKKPFPMYVQKAVIDDIKAIHEILNYYAGQGLLLPRSLSELYDHLRDYFVLRKDDQGSPRLYQQSQPAHGAGQPHKLEHGDWEGRGSRGRKDQASSAIDEPASEGHLVCGVCGLGICWEDLAEIRSLAVSEEMKGTGLGSRLVAACLEEAKSLGVKRVFTLTYVPDFFVRFGFREVEKSVLPHKIWADCFKCPKFPDCDETALLIDL